MVKGEKFACVVLGSQKESAVRRQFCAAHELAHLLLHQWDENIEELSPFEYRKQEEEANLFAGAFLLPKQEFVDDLRRFSLRLDTFVALKKKWKTSIGAMIVRAYNIGFINHDKYTKLMKSYSARGWRKCEPFDGEIVADMPVLAQKAVDTLLDNDIFTKEELLQEFSENGITLKTTFIEEALNLEPNTLTIRKEALNLEPIAVKVRSI